ncbi:hypothetical protein NQ317_000190 [Molorchus minor]|uniref:Potassium channel inwardly rectifying transmembrane domain-containing protein n=1 Tax=Molorchus minor TaxID=1323400 RepID=A0ABQ9JFU0_9CUCU|nr:hypothetical protein NQ317_000190 [Molorchus minor]
MVSNIHVELTKSYIIEPCIADHLAQILCIKIENTKKVKPKSNTYYQVRDLREDNLAKLKQHLITLNWGDIYQRNVDQAFNNFIELLTKAIDVTCPSETKKKVNKTYKKNLWLTDEIIEEQKKQLAEHFATYFATVATTKISQHFSGNISTACTTCEDIKDSFFMSPITPNDITDAIKALKPTNSQGVDGLMLNKEEAASTVPQCYRSQGKGELQKYDLHNLHITTTSEAVNKNGEHITSTICPGHGTKEREQLNDEDRVWIINKQCEGKIERKAEEPRSYLVRIDDNVLRRNGRHLQKLPRVNDPHGINENVLTANERTNIKESSRPTRNRHSPIYLKDDILETQHTTGYGQRTPSEECYDAIILMCIQNITGLIIEAFLVGIVFAKMTRPKLRTQTLKFSKYAVIHMFDNTLCISFRAGHCHLSRPLQLIGIANWEDEGDFISRPHRMPSNCKGQRTALWEQCSEPRRCQEDSAQEAIHLCQRGQVFNFIRYGFPKNVDNELLKPYLVRRGELSIDKSVVMWGYRVVVPSKIRGQLLMFSQSKILRTWKYHNRLENDKDLLPLEGIDATDQHDDSSDNEGPELNNNNQTVKSLNVCIREVDRRK